MTIDILKATVNRNRLLALLLASNTLNAQERFDDFHDLAVGTHAWAKPDSSISLSTARFDALVAHLDMLFRTQPMETWSRADHILFMRTINTLFGCLGLSEIERGTAYGRLLDQGLKQEVARTLMRLYPKNIPNRGFGFYFISLDMEFGGNPDYRSRFSIPKLGKRCY